MTSKQLRAMAQDSMEAGLKAMELASDLLAEAAEMDGEEMVEKANVDPQKCEVISLRELRDRGVPVG